MAVRSLIAYTFLFLVASFSIGQQYPDFRIDPLAEGVYAAIHQPGGRAISNAGIIDLGDKTILFDVFLSPYATQALLDSIQEMGLSPVKYVINSHYHNDHVRSNQIFDPSVTIISSRKTQQLIREHEPAEMTEEQQYAPGALLQYDSLVQNHPAKKGKEFEALLMLQGYFKAMTESHELEITRFPDLAIPTQMTLTGLERSVELIVMGEGHTPGDLILWMEDEGILFSGDLVFSELHPYLPDGNPDTWKQVLQKMYEMGVRKVVPGHGPVGDGRDLITMIDYLEVVKDIAGKMKTPEEIDSVVIPGPFDQWWFPNFFYSNLRFLYDQSAGENVPEVQKSMVKTEDGSLFVRSQGENGVPILLLSGGPGYSGEYLRPVMERLGKFDRVILPDLRGTGQSGLDDYSSANLNLQVMSEDLENLRKKLGISQWVVMGHAFGGMLAMDYASRYPNQIKGLILSNSGGIDLEFMDYFGDNYETRLSKADRDSLWYWENDYRKTKNPDLAREKRFRFEQMPYLFDRNQIDRLMRHLREEDFSERTSQLIWEEMQRNRFDLKQSLKGFPKPVLIIGGRQDPIGTATFYKIDRTLPNTQLHILDRCGHYPWIEQPEEYYEWITRFLNDL